ncbi:MAG: carboxypeptidase M32 [Lachnospiraceae bacterium]|nr:carboxypeptidase M32 [Lachnospiraceae bacterium]
MNDPVLRWKEFQKQLEPLQTARSILSWDLRTAAPKKAASRRVEVLSYFTSEIFRLQTSEEYLQILRDLEVPEVYATLDPAMKLTVDRSRKDAEAKARIPADFYKELNRMRTQCERAWEEAKIRNDWEAFLPWLKKNIEMTAQYARYLYPEKEIYEALLSQWVEGIDCAKVEQLFDEVRDGLVPLLRQIKEAGEPDLSMIPDHASIPELQKAEKILLSYMGLDMDGVLVCNGAHGLTGQMAPGDIRIINHYREDMPLDTLFTAIHEGGHALYDQNVDPSLEGTAAARLIFSDLHESQSRFYENILGRRASFWLPVYDQIKEVIPGFKNVSPEDLERAANHVIPSEVRTGADDVTYCLHIILRFQLEKELFRGVTPVEAARDRWNELMEEYLGVTPSDDTHGILQDLHWSSVYFGYFPTYLLGSLYDGMFLEALERDLGPVDELLSQGRILEITRWLKENIQFKGSLENPGTVLQRVCGKELSSEPLLAYFREKYTRLYKLS